MSIFNEANIVSKKDILYNKDKFDSGEINLCFVTGLSGSGKSTLSHGQENKKTEVYELDDLLQNYAFSDDNLKEYGDLIYSYFKGPGKEYRITKEENRIYTDKWEKGILSTFIDFSKQYANSHKNKKFIIEGVELYWFFKPEQFKDYAVYIKGTSALKSMHRSAWRDSSDADNKVKRVESYAKMMSNKDRYKAYMETDKTLNEWRNYFNNLIEKDIKEEVSMRNFNEMEYIDEAESELYQKYYSYMIMSESATIDDMVLNEDIKETLLGYLDKIKEGIQKVFDKIKDKIDNTQNKILNGIKEDLEKDDSPIDFTITNCIKYDTNKLREGFNIQPLDIERMKEALGESKEKFLQEFYPDCYDKELSIKDKIMKDITVSKQDTQCTKELLLEYIKFCLEDYKSIFDKIEADKKIIATSCDMAKEVVNASGMEQPRESAFILEKDEDNGSGEEKKDSNNVGFKDGENAKKNNNNMKIISSWCGITTSIYSGRIKALNSIRNNYYKTLIHHARLRGWKLATGEKGENKPE